MLATHRRQIPFELMMLPWANVGIKSWAMDFSKHCSNTVFISSFSCRNTVSIGPIQNLNVMSMDPMMFSIIREYSLLVLYLKWATFLARMCAGADGKLATHFRRYKNSKICLDAYATTATSINRNDHIFWSAVWCRLRLDAIRHRNLNIKCMAGRMRWRL